MTTVYNNDTDNSAGQGKGTDSEYTESINGKEFKFKPICARYMRIFSNGNTVNANNHIAEVQVYKSSVEGMYYYDAFGNITEEAGSVDNNITYAGYHYDKGAELYYCNARMYDPKIARFLQEDTYTGDPRDPLSLNLYTYCHNEPLMYTDPTGHFPIGIPFGLINKAIETAQQVATVVNTVTNVATNMVNFAVSSVAGQSAGNAAANSFNQAMTVAANSNVSYGDTIWTSTNNNNNNNNNNNTTPITNTEKKDSNDVAGKETTTTDVSTSTLGGNEVVTSGGIVTNSTSTPSYASQYYAQIYKERQTVSRRVTIYKNGFSPLEMSYENAVWYVRYGGWSFEGTGNNVLPKGTLTETELQQLQNVAKKYNTEIKVVGSRATGDGRNINTNNPVGKGPGTKSDIDVLIDKQLEIDTYGQITDDIINSTGGTANVLSRDASMGQAPYISIKPDGSITIIK